MIPHKIYAFNTYVGPRNAHPARHNKSTGIRILQTPYNSSYDFENFGKKVPFLFVAFNGNLKEFIEMALIFKFGNFCDTFHQLVRPPTPPDRNAFLETGITRDMTDEAPVFETVHDNIIEWLTRLQQLQEFDWKTILPICFDSRDCKKWVMHLHARDMPLPVWILHWCNIQKLISKKLTQNPLARVSLECAARALDISLDATLHHSAMNEAIICTYMAKHIRITANDFHPIHATYGVRCF